MRPRCESPAFAFRRGLGAMALSGLMLLAGPLLAQGNPNAGAAAFDSGCGSCHDDPVALMEPTGLLSTPDGATRLRALLARHHNPGASTDDVVAYLMSLH